MENYGLVEETLGYVTADDPVNTKNAYLISGSQNTLIDRNRKVKTRSGYSRLGVANESLTPVRNAWTWHTSTGTELAQRFYDDELEVYLTTVDGIAINAWKRVKDSWSTTEKLRHAFWYKSTEATDVQLMVNGNANIYEWSGAVAVVLTVDDGTHITKAGTTTWAQNRFYTAANKSLTCVRTGLTYTYSAGESTLQLTVNDSTGLVAGDILIQTVVTQSNKPASTWTNHNIFVFENQAVIGSEDFPVVYISKNTDYADFAYSTPRVAGEGALLTIDSPAQAFGNIGSALVIFAGRSSVFKTEYQQITVSTTLAETLKVKKLDTGVDQSAVNQECVVQISNSLMYLSYEPAVRLISNPEDVTGIDPKALSNPIKPDFDAEDFTSAHATWFKNAYYLSSSVNSRMYILEFVEDADGQLRRFWDPPQILPVGPMSIIDEALHGHSNAVPETYKLFDGASDINSSDEKLPFEAKAAFAYNWYSKRALLKSFDEYFVEGEITAGTTDLKLAISYDYGGSVQIIEKTIDGSNEDILEGNIGYNSLGQQSLGQNPLGGLLNPPSDARKFACVFEIAREDFLRLQATFSTNETDRYWAITAHGANAVISPRKLINRKL